MVSDVRQDGLDKESDDAIYLPVYQQDVANMHLLVRTRSNPMRLANEVAAVVHAIDPQQPVTDVHTLDQLRNAQLGTPRVTATLLGLFAAVALFITIVGVSGTLAYSVARQTKEIGIRIVLGSTRERILRNVLVRGMIPGIAGLVLCIPAAIFATRALSGHALRNQTRRSRHLRSHCRFTALRRPAGLSHARLVCSSYRPDEGSANRIRPRDFPVFR